MKTVQDLINALTQLPPNLPVLLSRDEEGNGHGAFTEATLEHCCKDGEMFEGIHPDDLADLDKDEREKFQQFVVLWP